jgi:hypothetical protein
MLWKTLINYFEDTVIMVWTTGYSIMYIGKMHHTNETSFYTKVTLMSYNHKFFLQTHMTTENIGTTIIYHWHIIKTSATNYIFFGILKTPKKHFIMQKCAEI